MNATAKFYTGLALVLIVIIAVSFAIGYRAGFSHAMRAQTVRGTHHGVVHATPVP